ncbi:MULTISPECIES: NlpC/P60 family protein [Bacillus]|uniref:NlpC/P60 family protein n=1 Tax=Bacillus TaxID=1386 RepID=UPI0009E94DCF|nr:NlpC/P60 family protein [Bacillus capparidis]
MSYVFGGDFTGFDCSGLLQWSVLTAKIILPRTANKQYPKSTKILLVYVPSKSKQPSSVVIGMSPNFKPSDNFI